MTISSRSTDSSGASTVISADSLRPYISLSFLECSEGQEELAFTKLVEFMRVRKQRGNVHFILVGAELANDSIFLRRDTESVGVDQIDALIHRIDGSPSWAVPGSLLVDVRHTLSIAIRRGRILAVFSDQAMRGSINKWLYRDPRPPLSMVSENILQAAFLRGETKGLWLQGTQTRSPTRPDSKYITGVNVEETLNPLTDSSFALSAARTALPDDAGLDALLGNVGTVPRKALVWNRPTQTMSEFMSATTEMLELIEQIEQTRADRVELNRPFPILAVESRDLSQVRGAYDIRTLHPDDLLGMLDATDEMVEAAEVLQRATLRVTGSSRSADFQLEVGMDGSSGGMLTANAQMNRGKVDLRFGYDPAREPTNPASVRIVLDALQQTDALTVYYDSGHVITQKGVWHHNTSSAPFPNWKFMDFSGFNITAEKPGRTPEQIHSLTGTSNDRSLFGWVVRHYSSGWLTCDDGPGEVADFLHISWEGTLSLIHVKKADSDSPTRTVSVGSFEVVASQAVKNSRRLVNLDTLAETLLLGDSERATWTDGERVRDRSELRGMLGALRPTDKRWVIIVQPHVSESTYTRIRSDGAGQESRQTREQFRLSTLETLLHTTRLAAVAVNADLEVIGSK